MGHRRWNRSRDVLRHLPRGGELPPDVWRTRHNGILALLWLHVPVILAVALGRGVSLDHGAVEAGLVAALASLATAARHHQRLSTVIAAVGLLSCSAVLVHLSGGLIEMHFHFFVMVGVVTLYQDWRPFLVAIGYVVLHHGIAGAIAPESVYNHDAAVTDPWRWAGVHGLFILGMSAAGLIMWRLNESLLASSRYREKRLAEAQEIASLGSWEYDLVTHDLVWSKQMYEVYGVSEAGFRPTRASIAELVHPEDRAAFDDDIAHAAATGAALRLDYRIVLPGGEVRWLHRRGEVTGWQDGVAVRMTGTTQDVTEHRRAAEVLRAHEAELSTTLSLLNATLDATADGILVVDTAGRIASFNRRFVEMWGIPAAVLESGDDETALRGVIDKLADPEAFLTKVRDLYARPDADSFDTVEFRDGRVFERYSRPQRVEGEIVGRVWSFRDVTERKRLEDELAHQAFHDPLTALANQALFRDRVEHALTRIAVNGGDLAVLFVDLDNFKTVNDSLGHTAGDALLIETTRRFEACLRAADTAARLGGDEFAVLIEDSSPDEVTAVAGRMLAALREPFVIAGREMFTTASIGIAIGEPGVSTDQLLRNADLAMYTAKSGGKGRYEVFAPTMHAAAVERLELEADLRRACERRELHLHYQPIVDLRTGAVTEVEALLRWDHPERGPVPPDVFVSLAEECGLIEEIGRWVLTEACAQLRRWHFAHPATRSVGIAVNLSPRQLRDDGLVEHVRTTLDELGLRASALTLEITEGAMMHDTDAALARLTELKALGLQLAVDDFGTGYSSLSYLQQLPIDLLKIDRSFVARLDLGPEDSALARAVVRLAHTLQLRAVAEGVERAEQLQLLRQLGCESAQGYYLSRPQAADVVGALLADGEPLDLGSPLTAVG